MLWRIKEALARFMFGRNGFDRFTLWLMIGYFLLGIVRSILWAILKSRLVDGVFALVLLGCIAYVLFRILSRNVYARREEERKFLIWWAPAKNHLSVIFKNMTDRERKYMVCPHCKSIIRFPRKKGVHSASCPKCRGPLTVKI